MKLFMCFGGAAPVADDEAAAAEAAAARLRGKRACRRPSSFRWRRFFPGKLQGIKKKKMPSPPPPVAEAEKRPGTDMDDSAGGGVFGSFASASSSSSRLSSSASSFYSHSYSTPSTPARSSSASCSPPPVSGPLSPAQLARRHAKGAWPSSPAAGAAAVVLCLLMVVFCGRVGATLLTPTAFYLFPRRWPAAKAHSHGDAAAALDSLQCDVEEETAVQRKVAPVRRHFLLRRNHNNN